MKTTNLSPAQFCGLLSKNQLPNHFTVDGDVNLGEEAIIPSMSMSNGDFTGKVRIKKARFDENILFSECNFRNGLCLESSTFEGQITFMNCTGKHLTISHCNINSLSWEGKVFDDFFIGNSEWEEAYPNNYPFARILELSKQNIYLKLSEILPYLWK